MQLRREFKISAIFLIIAMMAWGFKFMIYDKAKETRMLKFVTSSMPFSSDPLDYDYYIHHQAFTSVLSTLVSTNSKGKITPLIARSWEHSQDFTSWTFVIDTGKTYSNGDLIKADDFVSSFKRVAFLKKKNDSLSGLTEYLKGIKEFNELNSNLEGISSHGDKIVLSFTKPMPDLLTLISFGFYSLIHPSQYSHVTGEWLDNKKVISSGFYEVTKWTQNEFEISLRNNSSDFSDSKSIKKVKFISSENIKATKDLTNVDIILADKNSLLVDENFEYIGSTEGLKIGYVHCYSWNKPSNPLSRLEVRRFIRDRFLSNLRSQGFKTTDSFFPTTLKGIKPIIVQKYESLIDLPSFEIITHTVGASLKLEENKSKKSIPEIFDTALKSLEFGNKVKVKQVNIKNDSDVEKLDLVINGTGIESDNYLETVRFMFFSKQGILLPDSTGKIFDELKKENPDINLVNSELWNQAIIWPIRHYTNGFWFNKKSGLNFENVNLDSQAIDFQFYKWI